MQYKLHRMYLPGKLSETESDGLLTMASANVSPDAECPEILQIIQILSGEDKTLPDLVNTLESNGESGDADYLA